MRFGTQASVPLTLPTAPAMGPFPLPQGEREKERWRPIHSAANTLTALCASVPVGLRPRPMPLFTKPAIFSRPFFEDKSRAFWRLQAAGWTGYLILRSVSSISNGLDLTATLLVVIESIVGYCITLLLSTLYHYYRGRAAHRGGDPD